jgi:autotransporter-associated beta strand protein
MAFTASAQIVITNGVRTYTALTNTVVNMSGVCELRLGASTAPLTGCTINLNSSGAWMFLTGVKPSVAVSTCLSQVRINGAAAVADSNVRVVQYGQNGAVVIPHASTFQPLTVFTQPQFAGTATACGQWTYYTGTAITNISSFKLRRGYQAVFAQSANGASYSRCYIAQDGDLEVGVMPATLDRQVQFIYVTPWRWMPKKGVAGDPGISQLNATWWWNWNINSSSSRDVEYIPVRQLRWWPGLGQDWKTMGANSLIGYNEPDSPEQANIAVADAIWSWPDLLATGLRVGSPATTDGGWNSWLYPFMTQADAAGLRVDFVDVHYYRCFDPSNPAGAATQMYNALKGIYDQTKRPLWITEWNNGANWTTCADPTYAQQQACVSAMINMLEDAPFVERYAIYNWVEDVRSVTTNGVLTPAGVTYRDKVSNISHLQAMPDNGTRGIARLLFNTNLWDASGYYNNGMAVGAPSYTTGHDGQAQALVLDGSSSYVQLPVNIARGGGFTFAAWVYWNGGGNWQRIFDFGNDTSHYLFLTPSSGSGLRFAISNGGGERIVERPGTLASGSWQHVAVTASGTNAVLYVNGSPVATSASVTLVPSAFSPTRNFLGRSQFADPLFNGALDEVEIADYAMTASQISVLYNNAQYPYFTSAVWTNLAGGGWDTTNNWNGGWVAGGTGRVADFSQLNILADRTVIVDGPRTIGELRFGDTAGAQKWILSGTGPLTLDGGAPNAPTIMVKQNTATLTTPLAGNGGLFKNGSGTLSLGGSNVLGAGLTVNAGTLTVTAGTTKFGSGTSTVGNLTGSGSLTLTGGSLSMAGELRVGGSTQSGTQYNARGAVTLNSATLNVGSLTLARGNNSENTVSGAVTLNTGSTLVSTNDVILQYAGDGLGKLALNGGTFVAGPTASRWFMIGYWDGGSGELAITNGNLLLENGSSIKMCRGNNNTGSNVVNQIGGSVTFYGDAGVTVGGGGNLDLNYAGGTNSSCTYNLRGGTLTVPKIIASSASGNRVFNFNGGTLKAATNSTSFMAAGVALPANVRNAGAVIDTAGFAVTIGQALQHSTISGDSAVDGGLNKKGTGTLTLTGTDTYTGATTISGGTLALGAGGSISNSSSVNVMAGAVFDVSASGFTLASSKTLAGSGTINGAVTLKGTLSPGPSTGTLTFTQPPVMNGTALMELNRDGTPVSDRVVVNSGTLNYGGVLTVVNSGAGLQAGDTFQLFSAPGYGGGFNATNLPPLSSGLAWSNTLALNGTIAIIRTVSLDPTNVVSGLNGTNLVLSWPGDHTGWRLEAQTNSLDPSGWVTVSGSAATNQMLLPIDAGVTNVFFRLVYP